MPRSQLLALTRPSHSTFLRVVAGLLVASSLSADGLQDLRNALSRLQGKEPVQATVELYLWKRKADGGSPVVTQGTSRVTVEEGPGGLVLRFPAQTLADVAREGLEHVRQPDGPTPQADGLDALEARRLAEYLGYATPILRDLEQCILQKEEATTYRDKPARLLSFRANPSLPASMKKLLDQLDADVRVWTDLEGTPLGAEIKYTYKGSRFFMGFGGSHREKLEFQVLGKRLVVTRHEWEETYKGFGQESHIVKTYVIQVLPHG